MSALALLSASGLRAQTVNLAVSFKENTRWPSVSPADQEVTQRSGVSAYSPALAALTAALPASVDLDAGVVDTTGLNTPTPSPTPGNSPTPSATPTASSPPTVSPTLPPPTWCIQPLSQSANVGQRVSFLALAEGPGPITYQWRRDGSPLPGETSTLLTFASVTASDTCTIRCDATGPGGTIQSNTVNLAVFGSPQANSAVFLGHTVPATMHTNQTLNIGISYNNTSQLSWSTTQSYSVAVTTDIAGLFPPASRLYLPDSQSVIPPGAFAVFVGSIKAPVTPGVYSAQVRMIEEGVEFFGDPATINMTVLPAPNTAENWADYE